MFPRLLLPAIRPRTPLLAAALLCGVCSLAGCVTAESTRYQGFVNRSVRPQQTASADVADAFALRERSAPVGGLATADR